MQKSLAWLPVVLLSAAASFAQHARLIYTIAPWQDDKKAAVSLTFDDGISGQFRAALPLLNEHRMKATFFVTCNILVSQLGGWELVASAAMEGHEIANHALTHPHFLMLPPDSIERELILSNAIIEQHITPRKSNTHAYPFGEGGEESEPAKKARAIVRRHFIGARATRNAAVPYNPYAFAGSNDDYFKVNSDMIADSASMAAFRAHLDETIDAGGWYVPTYHGIADGWMVVPASVFERHLAVLEERRAALWIAPFASVIKYHRERSAAKLVVLSEDRRSWKLQLSDTLENTGLWDEPLTILLHTAGRKIESIQQGSKQIAFSMAGREIAFNVVPGTEPIILLKRN